MHEASTGSFSSALSPLAGSNPLVFSNSTKENPECCKQLRDFLLHSGGDDGIRTHEPRRANAFRVRPVMTTSIHLRAFVAVILYIKKRENSIEDSSSIINETI